MRLPDDTRRKTALLWSGAEKETPAAVATGAGTASDSHDRLWHSDLFGKWPHALGLAATECSVADIIRFIQEQAIQVLNILDAKADPVDRLTCGLLTNQRAMPQ